MRPFSLGDKVHIVENSTYAWQIDHTEGNDGTIYRLDGSWHLVEFPNGYRNGYLEADLVHQSAKNNKEAALRFLK